MKQKRIGILTGGGDAPGLNGIIESTAKVLIQQGFEVVGIRDGFEGVFSENTLPLTAELIHGCHTTAGSLLGASNKSPIQGREKDFLQHCQNLSLHGLVAVGGDGTFAGLSHISSKLNIIGLPKTIDNDLAGTDVTFGYDTACSVVSEAVESLRVTAETHKRIMVVETMGRTAGWIALGGGLASYADIILIPERPFERKKLIEFILSKKANGHRGLVIVIAEGALAQHEAPVIAFKAKGAPQEERYGGVGHTLSRWLEETTGWESRHVTLGHLQRSRQPTNTDRFLTLAMGVEAARMVQDEAWGQAVVYRSGKVQRAPLTDLMKPARLVDAQHRWVNLAQDLQIYI